MSTLLTLTDTAASPQRSGALLRVHSLKLANDGTAGNAGLLIFEDPTVLDDGDEVLANGGLASGTGYSAAGDASLANDQIEYLDSTHAGTVTQTAATFATALASYTLYQFTYTVSGLVGAPAGTITTGIALTAVTLDMTEGTHTVEFRTKQTPGNFVLSFTSTDVPDPEEFIMDDLSLVPVREAPLLRFPMAGTQHLMQHYEWDEPYRAERGLNLVFIGWDHTQVTLQYE